MNNLLLYCRPGFEKEAAAEITERASNMQCYGFARVKDDSRPISEPPIPT